MTVNKKELISFIGNQIYCAIYSFLNSKASQDKEFVENIKKQISNQNKEIINKLDDIKNRYKDKYSKEDSSDFEFIIDILKKKLE